MRVLRAGLTSTTVVRIQSQGWQTGKRSKKTRNRIRSVAQESEENRGLPVPRESSLEGEYLESRGLRSYKLVFIFFEKERTEPKEMQTPRVLG